jgi:ribosome biogenesis GTPase A
VAWLSAWPLVPVSTSGLRLTESCRLQERDSFLLTPFERNIEVWRQLWRVLERSQLVVQIVDARNPLRFRCEDLEAYVRDVEGVEGEQGTGKGLRKCLLLINKSDLLNAKQRCARLELLMVPIYLTE